MIVRETTAHFLLVTHRTTRSSRRNPARHARALDYRCVRLGDSFSLHFCHGWTEPQHTLEYTTPEILAGAAQGR